MAQSAESQANKRTWIQFSSPIFIFKNLSLEVCTCNPRTEEIEIEDPWGSLASQSSQIGGPRSLMGPCSPQKVLFRGFNGEAHPVPKNKMKCDWIRCPTWTTHIHLFANTQNTHTQTDTKKCSKIIIFSSEKIHLVKNTTVIFMLSIG